MDEEILSKIETFFSKYKLQVYKRGELLIRAEDDPMGIFYLTEGTVKQYSISKKGEEFVVNIFKPHSFFPMSWAINQTPNLYFYEATTDLKVIRAPKEAVLTFIKSNPDVLFNLLGRVYKGTDGILTRMTYLMSENAYTRLIIELLIYAKRFGTQENEIEIGISEKDLAAQSGLTRETVSREIKILKEKGLISVNKNHLTIVSLAKLEEALAT